MTIKNLTPHDIHIILDGPDQEGRSATRTIHPYGVVARAASAFAYDEPILGIPTGVEQFGRPVDLPPPEEGVWLVVSSIAAAAAREFGRTTRDLLVPAMPVRDAEGRVVGCRALARQGQV